MDEPTEHPIGPIEPVDPDLAIREVDSESTRNQKKLLSALSWEQKISLSAFVILLLIIPITMAAVRNGSPFQSQATQSKPKPLSLDATPTPTPPSADTVVPAP